jgi:anti-sigma B factor antagonist
MSRILAPGEDYSGSWLNDIDSLAAVFLERPSPAGRGAARMDLTLENSAAGERMVVAVGGEIDVYTAPKLRERLVELINSGHYHLVINLEGVDFLDSTGLGVLVGALKRVRSHQGSLRLVCTQERLLKIFRITGLAKVFPIYDTVDEAAQAAN